MLSRIVASIASPQPQNTEVRSCRTLMFLYVIPICSSYRLLESGWSDDATRDLITDKLWHHLDATMDLLLHALYRVLFVWWYDQCVHDGKQLVSLISASRHGRGWQIMRRFSHNYAINQITYNLLIYGNYCVDVGVELQCFNCDFKRRKYYQ